MLATIEKNKNQLLEELNIKSLRIDVPAEAFVHYSIQPNPMVLGPRFGREYEKVRDALKIIPSDEAIDIWRHSRSIKIDINDQTVVLEPSEFTLEEDSKGDFIAATSRELTVGINRSLSEELKQEGLVRDLIRQVQNMRKEADLRVEERIIVGISGDEFVADSLARFSDYFLAEVLGTEIFPNLEHPEHQKVVNLGGASIRIHIARA